MGLDMYLYNKKNIADEKELEFDNEKVLYWRGQRNLHDLFVHYGTKEEEEGKWSFDKFALSKLIIHITRSIMNVYVAAMDAYNEYHYADEKEYDDKDLFREYYVIGRLMTKHIDREVRSDDGILDLFTCDDDGTQVRDLVLNLTDLYDDMQYCDTVIYLASY